MQRFEWDDVNRLKAVHTTHHPGTPRQVTQSTHMRYDALGRRILKQDSFGTTSFIWEGMRLIEERRGSSVISYVYEPGSYVPLARLDALGEHTAKGGLGTAQDNNPSASISKEAANDASIRPARSDAEARYWASLEQTASEALDEVIEKHWGGKLPETQAEPQLAKVYYFHTDQVGLPEELTNAQGQIVWQASYKTWGNTIQEQWGWVNLDGSRVFEQDKGDIPDEEGRQQNLRFQGQYLDRDTGLHYNTFRYYDPDLGRFISPDPIGLLGGINLGSYAPNPIAWIDPWGLCGIRSNQVRYGDTPLSQAVIAQRQIDGNFNARATNYAAARIQNQDGSTEIIVRRNQPGGMHSEEVIIGETYPNRKILELYSERQPCPNCSSQLSRRAPSADYTHTFPYTAEGRNMLQENLNNISGGKND